VAIIQSAIGPLDTANLGFTLMHEHVLVSDWNVRNNIRDWWGASREEVLADAVARLKEAKAAGVDTMVDLTPIDLGRDVQFIQEAAQQSGMQIIVATGIYHHPPHFVQFWEVDDIVAKMVTDITESVVGTNVRCGIIKAATDEPGVTPGNLKTLQLAARLHRRTGVPISTHTHPATHRGLEQQDVFEQEGVDLGRVVIGHSGDTTDLAYLKRIIDRGSYIGMDRFGLDFMLPFEDRVSTIVSLCNDGLAGRIVLSHDASCKLDWVPQGFLDQAPNWNFLHVSKDVIPALKARGVSDADVEKMTVGNPREIFEKTALGSY
jgi:phosphotriesterase-related protein